MRLDISHFDRQEPWILLMYLTQRPFGKQLFNQSSIIPDFGALPDGSGSKTSWNK